MIVSYFLGVIEFGLLALILSVSLHLMNHFSISILRATLIGVALLHTLHLAKVIKNKAILQIEFSIPSKKTVMYIVFTIILWILIVIYPLNYLSLAPGFTDFSHTHFKMSVNIIRDPLSLFKVYSSTYPLYHAYMGASMTLSNNFAFIDNFIVSTIVQQLLLVAAAAMYVRAVLGARDLRSVMLVPLALLIFTGVGWSYLMVYPPQTSDKWFETLVAANEKTYRSVMYCQLTYFWPAPFGLAMSLYLLFLSNIMTSKSSEKIITILLSFALSTIHFPESIFLCIILSLIMFLRPKSFTADFVKDFVIGCLMGASLMKALEIMRLKGNIDLMSLTASYLIILLPLIALLLNNIGFVRNFMSFLSCKFTNLLNSKLNRIVVFSIHIFFLAGLLAAYDQSTDFAVSRADPGSVIGLVPWFMYPFLLGFMLPFGFTELVLNSSLDKKSKKLTIIIIFLAVLFGKTLSYINLHTYTGYWGEKRFLVFIYLALLPYSISLLNRALEYVFGSLNRRRSLLLYLLISLISVLSFGNILHYSAFWENYSRRAMMNDFEVGLSQFLSDLLWQNPERWVLPFGSRIWAVTNHAAPVYNTYVILPLDKILQPEHVFWMVNAYDLDAAPYFITF
ncbi:MAG: hypothetical protein QXY55_06700, partial [Candidatus Korarchaeota archaeon]